jgi:lysophospholipase L1-like esterase
MPVPSDVHDLLEPHLRRRFTRVPGPDAVRIPIQWVRRVFLPVTAAIGLGVVGVVGPAGCGLGDDRPRVAIIGDSITWQSSGPINDQLGDQWRVDVRGVPRATIGDMVAEASDMAARSPQQVVVNLGTNDVVGKVPPEQSAADLTALLDQFTGVECIHLVTVHDYIFNYDDGFVTQWSQATNEALGDVARRRGVNIIDWNTILAFRLAVPGSPDLLVDTVHPTPAGIDVLVDVYADALATGCPTSAP